MWRVGIVIFLFLRDTFHDGFVAWPSRNMSLCMHRARLANVMARLSESGVEYRTDLL